jgi:acetoin utilization deacetylase AcuC-like enzyme
MSVGLIYDPSFLEHETGAHPENAGRLRAVTALLHEQGRWGMLTHLTAEPAPMTALTAVHDAEYLGLIERLARDGGGMLTLDTVMSRRSFEVATLAAGAAMRAVDAALGAQAAYPFALVRPPGHHARPAHGMGFCLINNIAVAARHAVRQHRLQRVLVLDFDVHHGNGTEEIFADDASVFYISTHQYPAYPGTGALEDTGTGAGTGYTLNVPLPERTGDAGYLRVFDELLAPAVRRYRPELILVSAGYDAHWTNTRYLASIRMNVTVTGFAEMVRRIQSWAEELCSGRAAFVLEGGYDPTALAWSVLATLDVLAGRPAADPVGAPKDGDEPDISGVIASARVVHGLTG